MPDLLEAHQHATNNRSTIEASSLCGCFYCMHTFRPEEIMAWAGLDLSNFNDPNASADTALCPLCGSESVIGNQSGFEINAGFLSRMHEAWFERTAVHRPGGQQ